MSVPLRERAVLVSVQPPTVTDAEHAADLAELARLVKTLGYEVVATVSQRRGAPDHGAVLGAGKLAELARWTGGDGVVAPRVPARPHRARERWSAERAVAEEEVARAGDEDTDAAEVDAVDGGELPEVPPERRATVVVADSEITPSQARNLERATGVRVTDRTGVIVEIFHRHAHSREARLEVEIARLAYVAPRLRETGRSSGERQQGRGAGDTELELDRRRIRDRVAELRAELESIQRDRATRRALRRSSRSVVLVGYTNAGKSSLMRALTGSSVLVADQLFATLDTTVRALHPETRPRVLVSDTVGFIKRLPHDLVASFRSTLDEARAASLLLHLVDAADPAREEQARITRTVLGEIGAGEVPCLLVLNKSDRLGIEEQAELAAAHPGALLISAKDPEGVATVRRAILEFFASHAVEADLTVPYARAGLVHTIHESAEVVAQDYGDVAVRLRVRAEADVLERLQALLAR